MISVCLISDNDNFIHSVKIVLVMFLHYKHNFLVRYSLVKLSLTTFSDVRFFPETTIITGMVVKRCFLKFHHSFDIY